MADEQKDTVEGLFDLWRLLGLIEHLLIDSYVERRLDHDLVVETLVSYRDDELPKVHRTLEAAVVGAEYVQSLIKDMLDKPPPGVGEPVAVSPSENKLQAEWDEGLLTLPTTKWSTRQALSLIQMFISLMDIPEESRHSILLVQIACYENPSHLRTIHFAAGLVTRLVRILFDYVDNVEAKSKKLSKRRRRRREARRRL